MQDNKLSQAILLLAKYINISVLSLPDECVLSFNGTLYVNYDKVIKPLLDKVRIGSKTGRIKVQQEHWCTFCGTKLLVSYSTDTCNYQFGCMNSKCLRQPISLKMSSQQDAIDNYLERYD